MQLQYTDILVVIFKHEVGLINVFLTLMILPQEYTFA